MLHKFYRIVKKRDDKASAVLVMGIISMLFLCLCLGFALDLTKNAYLKNAKDSQAQQAVEIAVKTVNAQGSLSSFYRYSGSNAGDTIPDAVFTMVKEYNSQRKTANSSGGNNRDETDVYTDGPCSTREVVMWNGKKKTVKMPYMTIRIEPLRSQGVSAPGATFVSEGGATPTRVSGQLNPNSKYRVISAEVDDSVQNLMLGMFGIPCQNLDSNVSGIAFGNRQDIDVKK